MVVMKKNDGVTLLEMSRIMAGTPVPLQVLGLVKCGGG